MFGDVIKHDLSCLIFYFNTVLEHSYLLGRESLVCSLSWPHSPPLLSVRSGTTINVALWIACGYFDVIVRAQLLFLLKKSTYTARGR